GAAGVGLAAAGGLAVWGINKYRNRHRGRNSGEEPMDAETAAAAPELHDKNASDKAVEPFGAEETTTSKKRKPSRIKPVTRKTYKEARRSLDLYLKVINDRSLAPIYLSQLKDYIDHTEKLDVYEHRS
ncbi:MAG: hypothetical protein ACXABY_05550, partial [Candidatus Thorarchaeota archaeon]